MNTPEQTYNRLFGISCTHSFYTDQNDPHLSLAPTLSTKELMNNRDLLFHTFGPRAGIFYKGQPEDETVWLTFRVIEEDDNFINRTEVPKDLNFFDQQFYFSPASGQTTLSKGVEAGASDLRAAQPKAFIYTLPSGNTAEELTLNYHGKTIQTLSVLDGKVSVDLRSWPEGGYELNQGDKVVFSFLALNWVQPGMIGLIDIPCNLAGKEIEYKLPFAARKTYWQYLVVAKNLSPQAELNITDFTGETHFEFNGNVTLPDSSSARQFTSLQTLALQQRSQQDFQLEITSSENGLFADRQSLNLPPAGTARLKAPPNGSTEAYYSEIYVYV
ncbi:hypothetical protein KFE98_20065 [bacterium SCSIO 12741]|nr:hypothetical protein KFE98_20065 [bacterium SCSIO 12741]